MKQLIIILLLIIAFLIGFGKYNQYKRYNSPNVDYQTDRILDFEYHDQELVINYYKAIENINSYVMMQWVANNIDVRIPDDDDDETKLAVAKYADKLATIKYYETKLEKSASFKSNGLSNKEIKFLEETGTSIKKFRRKQEAKKILSIFNSAKKLSYGQKSTLIYEVQKKLLASGLDLKADGVYEIETQNAIKVFEKKNNLYADGLLDILTLDALLK